MTAHKFLSDRDGYHCDVCGATYHCPYCGDGCGMMGHRVTDAAGSFFHCQDAERGEAWRKELLRKMTGR